VVVVGAGPAGVAAACRAAEQEAKVLVLDDNPAVGGQIWRGEAAEPWLARLRRSGAEVRCGVDVVDERVLGLGKKVILATGARELFLPFPGWTLPGVFGVGGLQALVKSGLEVVGKRVVVAGSGPLLLAVASLLRKRGASVAWVAEQAAWGALAGFAAGMWRQPGKVWQGLEYQLSLLGVPFAAGCWVEAAMGAGRLERVRLRRGGEVFEEPCDFAAVGYGLVGNVELAALLGCAVEDGRVRVNEWQETTVDGVYAAGELTGIGGVELSLVEGEIAGLAACGLERLAERRFERRAGARRFAGDLGRAFALRAELKELAGAETIVCRCEDVRHGELAGRDGWREAKLQTRCGMGPCQGRVCGGAAEFLYGWRNASARPPVFPATIENLMESR
jgi:NADPH-dependent 2,4-dienoyl-CoA reductase/sulfur reductase-like enzyme